MHTFFFGAGAERDYGLCEGVGFAAPLMFGEFFDERKAILGEDISQSNLVFPKSRTVFLQTVENFREEAKNAFNEETIKSILICYNKSDSSKYNEAKEFLFESDSYRDRTWYTKTKDYYKKLKSGSILSDTPYEQLEPDDRIGKFFLNNMVFFDSIDEKFNSLRNVNNLNSKAKRVINAYLTVFILMLYDLYSIEKNFNFNYENIFGLLNQPYNKVDFNLEKSYYYALSQLSSNSFHIVTTNYTDICKTVTRKDVTYLHGNMRWFEDYKHLKVYDATEPDEREQLLRNQSNIFPFLLIPSGVKPIVCTKQIKQFSDFIYKLEESNVLWVVGYKFNSEDNHINSIISEWLRKPEHKMIFLNYDNSVDWSKMHWAEHLNIKTFDSYYPNLNDYLKTDDVDILNFYVKENCYEMFNKLINHFDELNER